MPARAAALVVVLLLGATCSCARPTAVSATAGPATPPPRPNAALVIDHTCVDADDQVIPAEVLDRARSLQVLLAHQSVGFDMIRGLERLSQAMPHRYRLAIGHQVQRNWYGRQRGLGEFFVGRNGDYQGKCDDFTARLSSVADQVDVASLKYCYADLLEQVDERAAFEAYRQVLEAAERDHPTLKVVWWTCPLMVVERLQDKRNRFNALVREHVATHGGVLFDLADIESHQPDGTPATDATGPMLWPGYARDNGHLNDAAAERVARGWWWLLARLTGWTGPTQG